jgi:dolichol-phosphate mannosyltransferase
MHMNGNTWFTAGEISALTEKAPVKEEHELRENLVIIPTYNEAINLKLLVPSVLDKGSFDVLIVDDNSPDGTGEVAETLAKRFVGRVEVLHRSGKLGLGSAYVAGFRYALTMGYQQVFTMDADFSHDPSRLPALRGALDEADVVLGSRYVPGGGSLRWPLWRRLLSRGGSIYARLMLGLPIHDLTGGFKGFRRQVLETLMTELNTIRSNGYAFQIEVTYLCARHGFQIKEVPIVFEDRVVGQSKMNRRIVTEALWVVGALRLSQGSARIHRDTQSRAQLMRQRLLVVTLALVFFLILLGSVTLVPQWVLPLVHGGAIQSASISHTRPASLAGRRSMPPPPAPRVRARVRTASLQLQGTDLTPNVSLHFVGSGFLPGEALVPTIEDTRGHLEAQLVPLIADHAGRLSAAKEAIPADLAPGTHTLLVQGQSSHRVGQARFQLHLIPPKVTLDSYSVKPGQDFGFAGGGFLSNEVVEVRLGSLQGERLAAVRANAGGNVAGLATIPPMPEGNYTLFFVGRQSQTPTSVGFSVQGFHPWVTLDHYALTSHMRLGFTGADFAPNEEVLVYLNQREGNPVMRIQADALGRLAAPAALGVGKLSGENTLSFVGQESRAVVTTTFTVVP